MANINLPLCTGYSSKKYHRGIDLLIHKYPNEFIPHRLRPILLFDSEANIHNNNLGKLTMKTAKYLEALAPEQYGIRKAKAVDIQALNTRLFYDITILKRIPATSTFTDLVSIYDFVVHMITSIRMQRANMPTEMIMCTFTTLQNMEHPARKSFG